MTAPRYNRVATHYRGDGCPGGHPELLPAPGATLPTAPGEGLTLLADLVTALHSDPDPWAAGWAARAQRASSRLHEAGIHTDQLVVSDWRVCPTCSMHPERHTADHGGEPS